MTSLPQNISQLPSPLPFNLSKKIVVLGTSVCPDCIRVKKFFTENKTEYEYYDLEKEKPIRKWLTSFSQTVPVIFFPNGTILYEPSNETLQQRLIESGVSGDIKRSEPKLFDTVIIGAGPAGISAAIYAVRKSLKVLVITKDVGGQAVRSGEIENLIGFTVVTGADLAKKFREEINQYKGENSPNGEAGIWLKEGSEVLSIEGQEGDFTIKTANTVYKGRTIIVASGRIPRMLNIPGEKEFFGKGVATCATCDAPLYKGKNVAVVGGGNSALEAALSLLPWANHITLLNLTETLAGEEIMLKKVLASPKVKVFNKHQILEILGKNFVEGIKIESIDTHISQVISVSGVFVEIGWTPSVSYIPQLAKDKQNQIIVDEFGRTSVPGIWAAGDVNNLWGEQIIIAAGEGAKTALVVAEHLAKIPHQATSNVHMG